MWSCKYCNKEFNFEKPQSRGADITNCKANPKRQEILQKISKTKTQPKIKLCCELCGKYFFARRPGEVKNRRFCSKVCSNKRPLSKEMINKLKLNLEKGRDQIQKTCHEQYERWINEADKFFEIYKNDPLFLLGIGLYWGEGFKRGRQLGIVNSDFNLLNIWINWHKTYIPNINYYGSISAHLDVDEDEAITYWSKLGIEKSNIKLYRAIPKSSKGKRPKNRLPFGTLQIRTSKGSYEWHTKMMRYIQLLSNKYTLNTSSHDVTAA